MTGGGCNPIGQPRVKTERARSGTGPALPPHTEYRSCRTATEARTASGHTRVIAAAKVQGTSVTNPARENLGSIRDVVLDKYDGTVRYAVLQFGGFLGMGSKLFALPWELLRYDEAEDAYVLNIQKDVLQAAPRLRFRRLARYGRRRLRHQPAPALRPGRYRLGLHPAARLIECHRELHQGFSSHPHHPRACPGDDSVLKSNRTLFVPRIFAAARNGRPGNI
ncbi:MAG: PRC-barrel domain-containing protein [Aliidongia sp.]